MTPGCSWFEDCEHGLEEEEKEEEEEEEEE